MTVTTPQTAPAVPTYRPTVPLATGGEEFIGLLGGVASAGLGAFGFGVPGLGNIGNAASQVGLLRMQNQIQQQQFIFTAQSNISKTQHEGKMNAARNFRAS